MQDVIDRIIETLIDEFSGTSVGDGGTFSGSGSLSFSGTGHGPFDIQVNTQQWESVKVTHPSINFRMIQSEPMGSDRLQNTGGKHRLWTEIRVSVDQQEHGQSIAGVMSEAVYSYLGDTRFQPSGSGKEVYIDSDTVTVEPEGQLLHYIHLILWNYHF